VFKRLKLHGGNCSAFNIFTSRGAGFMQMFYLQVDCTADDVDVAVRRNRKPTDILNWSFKVLTVLLSEIHVFCGITPY
jgi:hypothetical protein